MKGVVEEKVRFIRWVQIVLFSFSIFLFVIVVVAFLMYFMVGKLSSTHNEVQEKNQYTYRYSQINTKNNESKSGLLHLNQKIEESIFYQSDEDVYYLISDFGTTEYRCIGSCICEDEDDESSRRTTITLVNGIVYLVAAVSSLVAYNQAKNYLEDRCSDEEDIYPCGKVRPDIEECQKFLDEIDEEIEARKQKRLAKRWKNRKPPPRKRGQTYQCFGNCLDHDLILDSHNAQMSDFPKVVLDDANIDYKEWFSEWRDERGGKGCESLSLSEKIEWHRWPPLEWVRTTWILLNLDTFCIENSQKDPEEVFDSLHYCNGFENVYVDKIVTSDEYDGYKMIPDIGVHKYDSSIWDSRELNPTVECILIDAGEIPKPEEVVEES